MRAILATAICCLAAFTAADAHAGRHHRNVSPAAMLGPGLIHMLQSMQRPQAWCGWYMRHIEHVADPAYNRAAAWAHDRHRAPARAPGVIVVWPHHVGVIRGGPRRHRAAPLNREDIRCH